MADCNHHQYNQSNYYFSYFLPYFSILFVFLQLDLLAAATTSKVVVVHASPPYRCRLAGGGAPSRSPTAPLTAIGPDKTGQSGLPNRTIWFLQFRAGASAYSATSAQLTTPIHGYRGDTTRQDGTTVRAMFSAAEQ
jgi:hypothetical protein